MKTYKFGVYLEDEDGIKIHEEIKANNWTFDLDETVSEKYFNNMVEEASYVITDFYENPIDMRKRIKAILLKLLKGDKNV